MQWKINLTRWFVYEWGKPTQQKPHRVILRSPFPKFHYYHNKRLQEKESQYLIPTYSWNLTSIPNWICSVVTISSFDARLLSTWLTNCVDPNTWLQSPTWEGCWLQNSSVYPTRWRSRRCLVTKPFGVHTQQLLQEWLTRAKLCPRSQFAWTDFAQMVVQLVNSLTALKTILFICLMLGEKKAQWHIHGFQENHIRILKFLNLDK